VSESTTIPVEGRSSGEPRPPARDTSAATESLPKLLPERLAAALRPDTTHRDLPHDLLQESRRRVRIAAAIGAAGYAAFLALESSGVLARSALESRVNITHDLLGIILCVAVLIVTAARGLRDEWVLRTGLIAQVALSALISFGVSRGSVIHTGRVQTLTWVVPIIILAPLLVPVRPGIARAVSILCALTTPAAFAILARMGQASPRVADYWQVCVTGAVAVGIAEVASRTVYGAGRQVAAARRVGSYELLEPLGRGGMGEVWRARHLLLARQAAIKWIQPEWLQGPTEERQAALQRFAQEAEATAALRSPHTVELFDFGVTSDGRLYYAMELLDGINIEQFVDRFGPVEPRRAVDWLRQACHSLGEAHARGLIHRDIKPANLFLCRYGRDVDFVKVLDFGLARPTRPATDPRLTMDGMRLGTPGYMAPEQIFDLDPEPRTDLYALGCVGYWLLTGVPPFEAKTAAEVVRLHAQVAPPPPSTRGGRPLPPRLEAVIMACLAKEPSERPRDADALSEALDLGFEQESWTQREARAWWDRNLGTASSPSGPVHRERGI